MTRGERVENGQQPEFRWLERGEGEPLILLHGLLGRMDHWESSLEELGDRCRAVAPALPIYDMPLAEASIGALARHVVAFMDALELPRAVLGGNSLGGHVALEVALDHPERVSGLILTGSSGLFERTFTRGVPHRPTVEYVRERMREVVFDPALVTPAWVESVCEILTTRHSAMRVVRFARAARRGRLEERLGAIQAPTLLVWGADDLITPLAVAERFRALIPGAELALIGRCGHAAMIEQPGPFNKIAADWLAATRSRRERLVPVGSAR